MTPDDRKERENIVDELDCKIYVDAGVSLERLTAAVADRISGTIEEGTVRVAGVEMDILSNDDFDEVRRAEYPDGFLSFRYLVEIYASPERGRDDQVKLVSSLLSAFWSQTWPAVAACDYEESLPFGGGFKSDRAPWPAAGNGSEAGPPETIPPVGAGLEA